MSSSAGGPSWRRHPAGGARVLALALAVALAATGCAGDGSSSPAAQAPSTTSTTTTPSTASEPDPYGGTVPRVDPAGLACPADPDVASALRRATAYLQALPTPRVDATWALGLVAEAEPWLEIGDPLQGRRLNEPSEPARRLLDDDVTPTTVARDGEGAGAELVADINEVFAPESDRSTDAIDRFTGEPDLTGYALAHQWLVLIWARQIGRDLPEAVTQREASLAA